MSDNIWGYQPTTGYPAGKMSSKAHAVCIPYPAQSHIKAMLKLAKLLHDKGIYVTFVNTEYNHNRFLKSGGLNFLLGLPDFKFETIPDGLPSSDGESTQDLGALCESVTVNFLGPFVNLVRKLESPEIPPVSCIVSDGFMGFTLDAGERLGIPVVFLWTLSACAFLGFYQCQKLMDNGIIPVKDESCLTEEFLNTIVDWVPGEDFMRFRDLSSFARTTNADEIIFKFTSDGSQRSRRASANILETFRELEPSLIDFLSSVFSRLYTIGPLELLQNNENDAVKSNGYSLWKEEPQCMEWLNSKKPNSVIYVNFGSIAALPPKKMTEFAFGLANSDQNLLFIIRKDTVEGETGILPPEFFEMIKERGFITTWCQQEDVLNHPSVGGFLTHGGWNSIIESLSAGVPMICLPFFGDQMTNCRYLSKVWEVGIELDGDFDRVDVEKVVRELMEGEKGEKLKTKAKEWKKIAIEACGKNGSSSLSLDELVRDFFGHK
jgi:hypothetical protein